MSVWTIQIDCSDVRDLRMCLPLYTQWSRTSGTFQNGRRMQSGVAAAEADANGAEADAIGGQQGCTER